MAPEFGKPIHQLPLIPTDVLKKHRVHEPLDTRFRSAARLLQALWREDRDLPIGSYITENGKRRKLGSRISEAAGKGGGNFLTPEIGHVARRETAYREIGALIDAERLATNLLSSMPLTFNLLAPWMQAPERASGYLRELLLAVAISFRTFARPRQPKSHERLHGLRRPDPLLGLPGPHRLRCLRNQIFREHARGHCHVTKWST
jgi:hypothetical protein